MSELQSIKAWLEGKIESLTKELHRCTSHREVLILNAKLRAFRDCLVEVTTAINTLNVSEIRNQSS